MQLRFGRGFFLCAFWAALCGCQLERSRPVTHRSPKAEQRHNTAGIPNGWTITSYGKESKCSIPGRPPPSAEVEGDFDGDGIPDYAKILKQVGKRREQMVVWLSSKGFDHPVILDSLGKKSFNRMSISLAKKGEKIQSTCDRGLGEPCETDTEEVELRTDAIWLELCASVASVFYWDGSADRFQRQWYSD